MFDQIEVPFKRDLYVWKETHSRDQSTEKRLTKETHTHKKGFTKTKKTYHREKVIFHPIIIAFRFKKDKHEDRFTKKSYTCGNRPTKESFYREKVLSHPVIIAFRFKIVSQVLVHKNLGGGGGGSQNNRRVELDFTTLHCNALQHTAINTCVHGDETLYVYTHHMHIYNNEFENVYMYM